MSKRFEDFDEEAKQYKEIILNYRDKGEVFIDKNFHPTAKILEKEISFDASTTEWLRIDDVYDAPLFKKELIHYDFIKQGSLSNINFISAISCISHQQFLIPFLFDRQVEIYLGKIDNSINLKCGAVVIYFHAFGRKTPVLIDTLIPFSKITRTPLFSHPSDTFKSAWFCLVEKAYAKLNESYTEIINGSFSQAMYSLYGYISTLKRLSDLQSSEKTAKMSPFDRILKYQNKGSIITASIHSDKNQSVTNEELINKGLISTQPYLIQQTKQYEGNNFISLRSPSWEHQWNGDWSNYSPKWTSVMRSKFHLNDHPNTNFWMSDSDFFKYFTEIEVSRPVKPEYHSCHFFYKMEPGIYDDSSICTEEAFNLNLPRYAIQVTEDFSGTDKCLIHILCERRRRATNDRGQYESELPPYCIELKSRHLFLVRFRQMAGETKFISFPYLVKNNNEMLVLHLRRLGKCDYDEDCVVKVYCNRRFQIIDASRPEVVIPEDPKADSVFGSLSQLVQKDPRTDEKGSVEKTALSSEKAGRQPDRPAQNSHSTMQAPPPSSQTSKHSQSNPPLNKYISQGQFISPPKMPSANQTPEKVNRAHVPQSTKPRLVENHPKERRTMSHSKSVSNKLHERSKTPPSSHKARPSSRQFLEKAGPAKQAQSPSQRPKQGLARGDATPGKPKARISQHFSNPAPAVKSKREFILSDSNPAPVQPNPQKMVKAKPPKSIDLNDDNIRKMYKSIRTNVFSSFS